MGFHVAGWAQNVDGAGAEADMNAITDTTGMPNVLNTTDIQVDNVYRFLAALFAGVDDTVAPKARLKSPSLDALFGTDQSWVPWINGGTSTPSTPTSPPPFNDWRAMPIPLAPSESLKFKTLNNPAAAIDQVGIAFFSDGPIQAVDPNGGFWCRGTLNSSATTSLTWALRTWTPDTTLPAGKYAVLDAKYVDAGIICGREVFPNQVNRPGAIGLSTETKVPPRQTEIPGQFGQWGVFSSLNVAKSEILTTGAVTRSQVVWKYLKQVSSAP